MPSLNQVTTKFCILQDYDYYVMTKLVPNKIQNMGVKYLNLKKKLNLSWNYSMCHARHMCQVFKTKDSEYSYLVCKYISIPATF
jgi:ribosomal protein L7Ae-like RNA K-turn-binding protein